MSEFQYYEFVAVDHPITPADMRALRAITSRATITPTRLVNTYQWGDFKGDPLALVGQYFDAFLYYANWGTHRLMLRLPRTALAPRTAAAYCGKGESGSAVVHTTPRHVILEFRSEDESGEWEGEPEGWLGSLIPLRDALAGGDERALYLGWLLRAQVGELRGTTCERPVPPGLGALTAPLDALVDFLRLDRDLIAAAAERSAPPKPPTAAAVRRWVRALDPAARDAWLERLALGDGPGARAALHAAVAAARQVERGTARDTADTPPRTAADLLRDASRRREAGGRRPPGSPRTPDEWAWEDE